MQKIIFLLLFITLHQISLVRGQNLVTNPGFEEKYKCPNDRSEIIQLRGYSGFPTVLDWVSALNTSPDYYNRCATNDEVRLPNLLIDGFHEPRHGDGCAGISMFAGNPYADTVDYWAEYLETRLASPLVAGHDYYICYYVCLTHHNHNTNNIISIDKLGGRLTNDMIDTNCSAPMFFLNGPADISSPDGVYYTDTVNWSLVSGIYHANGGEQWLTIGRFYSEMLGFKIVTVPGIPIPSSATNSVCYMLVDDVCVTDMSYPIAVDTMLYTPQFPVTIGRGFPAGRYEWENGDTSLEIEVTAPGTYSRKRWSECGYYNDKITIAEAPVDYCVWLPSAFTPNGDGKNDNFGPGNTYCHQDFLDFEFTIYNRFGQVVFQTINPGLRWDGRFGGVPQETGVYFYTLRYLYAGAFVSKNNPDGKSVFLKGDVTLIR